MASVEVKQRARYGHCAIAINGTVYIWGGRDENARDISVSDIDVFSTTTIGGWERKVATGALPRTAFWSACAAVDTTVYQFGGLSEHGHSNELHCLNAGDLRWSKVEVRNPSEGPQPKSNCGMVAHGSKELVLIGGELEDGSWVNELHTFNFGEGECI